MPAFPIRQCRAACWLLIKLAHHELMVSIDVLNQRTQRPVIVGWHRCRPHGPWQTCKRKLNTSTDLLLRDSFVYQSHVSHRKVSHSSICLL